MALKIGGRLILLSFFGLASACVADYNEAATIVKLVRAEERRAVTTYWNTGSGRATSEKHLLRLVFRNGLSGGGPTPEQSVLLEESTTAAGGTVPPPPSPTTTRSFQIYVVDTDRAGEPPLSQMGMSAVGTRLPTVSSTLPYRYDQSTQTETQGSGLWTGLSSGEEVGIDLICGSDDKVLAAKISVGVHETSVYRYYENGHWWKTTTQNWQVVTYDIQKAIPTVASIDSRTCYGQPNLDGALIADANAEARNPSFAGWLFKGGLFAGNMPWQTGDQSGTARVNASFGMPPTQVPENLRMVAFTMFHTGMPASVAGPLQVGAFLSSSNPITPWTWDGSQWGVAPRSTPTVPPDYSQDPISAVTLDSQAVGEYANWSQTVLTPDSRTTPLSVLACTVFAVCDEGAFAGAGQAGWRYFSSPAYEAAHPDEPILNDSRPRQWRVFADHEESWTIVSGPYLDD